MKAPAVVNFAPEAGSVEVREFEKPTIGSTDVLVQVAAVGVSGSDLHQYPKPLYFWEFNMAGLDRSQPYIAPELQRGTTPLVKKAASKATRDFSNFRHPATAETDYLGSRAIIDGDMKLVLHEPKDKAPKVELFDLKADPAEKTNLLEKQAAVAEKLQTQMRDWQSSVLNSLSGADYAK